MKCKITYLASSVTALLLCLVMLGGMAMPAVAESTVAYTLDYGITGRENNTSLSAVALYERLFGTVPTHAEAAYLQTTNIALTYNSLIPDDRIVTDYNGDTGVLSVTVSPYSYTASNGATVTWTPTVAIIDGVTLSLVRQGDTYVCSVADLYYSEDFEMRVHYEWMVEIPAEIVRELRLSAYQKGSAAMEEQEAYERSCLAYEEQLTAYNEWQEYLAWLDVYANYEADRTAYEAALEAYEAYCRAYEAYEAELAVYEQWQAYFEYTDFVAEHLQAYNAYKSYLQNMEPVTAKLALLESLFLYDSHSWQMYGSIMGPSVDTVLKNEDLLVNQLRVNEGAIRLAADATEALRKLLPQYATLRNATYSSEYERTRTLYAFYSEHYTELAKHFSDLYSVLNELFQISVVKLYIMEQGKYEHYLQFVGQLYVVSTCFDSAGARNPNWTISGQKLEAVVEPIHLLADGDWDPATSPIPAYVEPVEKVEPIDPPAGTPPTQRPVRPTTVANPGEAPTEPENPFADGAPAEAVHPGALPTAPVFDALTQALMQEINDGILTEFTGAISAMSLGFESTVKRNVSIRNLKTVTFYNADGTPLETVNVDYGASLTKLPAVPELLPTAQYTFTSVGWSALDGSEVDFGAIKSNLSLYPVYTKTVRSYYVTWILGDQTKTQSYLYGDTPQPPAAWSLDDYIKDHVSYTFSGWDKAIVPVTGEAEYRGEMIGTLLKYRVTWILAEGVEITEEWDALSTPVFSGDTARAPDSCTYVFVKWKGIDAGLPLTGDRTYYAQYDTTKLAVGGANTVMEVEHTDDAITVIATNPTLNISNAVDYALQTGKSLSVRWENGFEMSLSTPQLQGFGASDCKRVILQSFPEEEGERYELRFLDAFGNDMATVGNGVSVRMPHSAEDETRQAVFFTEQEGVLTRLEGNAFVLPGSVQIRQLYAYGVAFAPSSLCNVATLADQAVAGETVSLKTNCLWGYELSGAEIVDAEGNVIPVSEDMTFVMPASPVSVSLNVTEIRYTVTFMFGEEVWSYAEYALGETILQPDAPSKSAEGGYSYTFTGWGDVPAIASGDVRDLVFVASFAKARQNVDYSTGYNNNLLMELYVPLFLGIFVLVVGGLVTFLVIRKRRRRRHYY